MPTSPNLFKFGQSSSHKGANLRFFQNFLGGTLQQTEAATRLLQLCADILRLVDHLPERPGARAIERQLLQHAPHLLEDYFALLLGVKHRERREAYVQFLRRLRALSTQVRLARRAGYLHRVDTRHITQALQGLTVDYTRQYRLFCHQAVRRGLHYSSFC